MITAVCVALAVTFGALLLHSTYYLGALKGFEQGLDEAERIARETHDEYRRIREDSDRA